MWNPALLTSGLMARQSFYLVGYLLWPFSVSGNNRLATATRTATAAAFLAELSYFHPGGERGEAYWKLEAALRVLHGKLRLTKLVVEEVVLKDFY